MLQYTNLRLSFKAADMSVCMRLIRRRYETNCAVRSSMSETTAARKCDFILVESVHNISLIALVALIFDNFCVYGSGHNVARCNGRP